jgi:hypothetical protein
MIDPTIFAEEMIELQAHFDKTLSDRTISRYKSIFDQALTTDEFKQGVIWAYRYCKPHPSFFPSPQEIIEASQGTLDDRALLDWVNINIDASLLSPVGRKALQSIGGSSTVRMSEKPDFLKKDFIAAFKAFASKAVPDELRRYASVSESRQLSTEPSSNGLMTAMKNINHVRGES